MQQECMFLSKLQNYEISSHVAYRICSIRIPWRALFFLSLNITFESHQRRKKHKTKAKQFSSAWITTKNSCFQLLFVVFTFIEELGYQQKMKNLKCPHDKNNPFGNFAIKTMDNNGHLPLELSRITKFLIDRGAKVEAQLSSTNYRRSPLIQGGLEISCDIIVTMPGTIDNQLILEKYKKLVCGKYAEPKEEVIIGSFLERDVIAQTGPSTIQNQQKTNIPTNNKKKADKKKPVSSYDIRSLLSDSRPNVIKKKIIEIDLTD